ncbi:hypothetical protein GCM10007425_29260 [Lysinibacillus alkalisoli]|uniref:ParB-like N-terminal domain-containing protein n=1 Tax=Lysinibacillus alkalisoli TaxID=1911548 RepID=A0A917LJQ4_9BACI|nr:DUF3850 domain-containing protein [Lysinibacillus alkalisoli]GGG32754.1 hypothetical protein GCM10007425_29260 [Lysinibacillus alkalisoli]
MARFNLNDLMNTQSKEVGKERVVFKIELLPIEQLQPSIMNQYSVQDVTELKASIELTGLQQNLLVRPNRNGYEVLSGHRRLKAMQALYAEGNEQFAQVPCKVERTMDDVQAELQLLLANSTTRELTDYEKTYQAQRLQELLQNLKDSGHKITGRKREIVAQLMGVSSSQVARMESINKKLSPELKEEFSEGNLNITTAYELSRLPEVAQQEVVEEKKAGKEITPAVVKEKRKEIVQPLQAQKETDKPIASQAPLQEAEVTDERIHELNIHPEPFSAVVSGAKTFEYRFNDRDYRVGDILRLNEYNPIQESYTNQKADVIVTFILEGGQYDIPTSYVIMSIKLKEGLH